MQKKVIATNKVEKESKNLQNNMARPRRSTAKITYRVPGSDSEDEAEENENENPFFLPMEIPRIKLNSSNEPKVKTNRSDDRTIKKPRRKENKSSNRMKQSDSTARKPEMSDSSMASTTLKAPAPQAKYQSEEESIASFSMGKEADYSHKIDSSPIKPMSLDFDSVDNGQMSAYQSEEEENEENTYTQVKYCVESSFKNPMKLLRAQRPN
jgi:hypothetical protein